MTELPPSNVYKLPQRRAQIAPDLAVTDRDALAARLVMVALQRTTEPRLREHFLQKAFAAHREFGRSELLCKLERLAEMCEQDRADLDDQTIALRLRAIVHAGRTGRL